MVSRFNSEFDFQTALIKRLKDMWAYVRNIADIWNIKKPFDISMNYLTKWWALELKIVKTKKEPLPEDVYKKLLPHQIVNLLDFQWWKSMWVALAIAYHTETDKVFCYKLTKWEKISINQLYVWTREWQWLNSFFNLIFSS